MQQIETKRPKAVPDVAAALLRGDLGAARRGIGRMLDAGDMALVTAALEAASCGGEALRAFEHRIERAAQRVAEDGREAALFCVPVFGDPARLPALDAKALAGLLASRRAPAETFALLDGWLRTVDLMRMQATDYRALVRRLAAHASAPGTLVADLPAPHAEGDVRADPPGDVWIRDGAGGLRRVGVRYVLGVAVRPSGRASAPGLFADLVAGRADNDALDQMGGTLAPGGAGLTSMAPGMPIWVGAGCAAALDCIALEARMEGVALQAGRAPIVHFAIDDHALHVVVTRDGASVLDAFRLCRAGLDGEEVFAILRRGSAGLVDHRDPSALPPCPSEIMN